MKNFVIYKESGQIIRSGVCQDETFDLQALENEFILEGVAKDNQYVLNGSLVDMPTKPTGFYAFNYDTKLWEFDYVSADTEARALRNSLLAEGPDRVNPIWWSSMSFEQQQQWTNYRQALLDVTEQINYPEHIVWPTKPV